MLGASASTAISDWTLRAEMAGFLGRPFATGDLADRDGVVRADELSGVLGLDWFGLRDTVVSWQLFQSWLVREQPALYRDRAEFDFTQMVRREFFDARLTVELMWLQGLNRGDGLVRPKVKWELGGRSEIWLGADVFYGNSNGLFGQFDDQDRIVAGFRFRL
jgi:hypothetical protein